ncbi:ATP-binding protein [Microbispora oryzae]|nr:ATP-binding protein [Microbispora oryzae]
MARFGMRALPAALLVLAVLGAVASVPLSLGREPLYDTILYPVNGVALTLAGALIASYQWRNPLGWLLVAMGVEAAWVEFAEGYGYHPGWPAVDSIEWVGNWANMLGIGATALVLTLFPTGRGLSPGRRVLVWAGAVSTGLLAFGAAFGHASDPVFRSGRNPYALDGLEPVYLVGQVLFSASLVMAIVVLVVRFVRSRGIERQQLKWVAYVVALLAVAGPLAIFFYNDSVLVQIAIAVVVTGLPAAICVAILRYRLYDIDIIINRTLVYGLLTVLLAATYLGTAFVLGALIGQRGSPWVTAGATLAAATAFRPLRSRIQRAVDRRFRPARYEAFARVDAFLADLRAGQADPEALEALLRAVTERPDLQLRYVLPNEPVPVQQTDDGRVTRIVERAGTPLAVLTYIDTTPDTVQLLVEVVERAGLAVEIGRLRAELHRRLLEVEASRARIVAAAYEERRRLERDLHDGAQQRLVSVGLALRHTQFALSDSAAARAIDGAVEELTVAIAELRVLAQGVRPAYLDDGLDVALRELASRTPLPVTVHIGPDRFPTDIESTAYFVACEALTNAVKHSGATYIEIQTRILDDRLVLIVRDNGIGGAQPARGTGLRGLSDRVSAQGGRLHVESRPGAGTTLTAELPCGS